MNSTPELAEDLSRHLALCQEILALSERENQALRDPRSLAQFEIYQTRKSLLPKLDESVTQLRQARARWYRMTEPERAGLPQVPALIRQNQDLVMRIIVLDRENEQIMLRRGLVPPRHLPSPARQRPHFVADLYRRNRVG
jgi:hypothetical protein